MPPKRKRPERGSADANGSRPSPHRPGDTALGQHDRNFQDGGARYGGRGGARGTRRSDRRDTAPNNSSYTGPSSSINPPSPSTQRLSATPSQAITPAPRISNAQLVAVEPDPPSPIASGYQYIIVTDERVANWANGGRQEVIDHGIQSREDEDITELTTIFQELLQSCLDYRLKAPDAGSAVKDILGPQPEDAEANPSVFDAHTLFLDSVSIFIDVETGSYKPQLRDLMIATDISLLLMRKVLEPSLLEQIGLIRDTFTKIGIRQVTNILYRQANYNLLREETEGYSKLITELFTTSNSEPPTAEAVQAAFERVKGLIGTFDLDVGRTLDVTLDVFAAVLIKQFRFFVKFLRVSSWWPRDQAKLVDNTYAGGLPKWGLPESSHWATSEEDEAIITERRLQRDVEFWERARQVHLDAFFELGGRRVPESQMQRLQEAASDSEGETDLETQWALSTKTLAPPGNRVAAQLLGFKLRYYESDVNDTHELVPANLFYMAALLIKIGFLSLCDLYPHISPADDKMEEVREARMKALVEEEREKSGTALNALSQLGVLPDDEKDVSRISKLNADLRAQEAAAATAKVKTAEPIYQKVKLLEELLTLGAIPESLFILGRFPWLTEAFPHLLPLIHRLLHHSIDKVHEECRSRSSKATTTEALLKKLPEQDQSGVPKGVVKLSHVQPKRALRWPHPDGEKDGQPYRCYWEDWADNVPVCQTVDDVFTLCGTLMNVSGVNIGKDAVLMTKLANIGAKSLAEDRSDQNMARWQDLLKRLLVPALSLTDPNSSVVNSVWNLLKLYPLKVRYNIYAEWYDGQISRLPPMRTAFARTRSATKRTLKRLSLQNLSAMAKKLAKAAYSSPGIVFKESLSQIEAYSNLIQAFVECARYFTDMGYDVLVWSLMSSLGGGSRSRTQSESVLLTSRWLQALSKFSGQVFKRYPNMKPTAVLQYVNDQLSKGSSTDLVILRELITNMAGIVPDSDFTDAQLKAMTGGDVLRRQTLIGLGDRRYDSVKGAKRLMQSLVDTKLAGRLLINLAQYRQSSIFRLPEDESNIKYLATIMDETQEALTQYLELLRSNLAPDQFDAAIPSITQLMQEFGLDVSLAFMIGRGSLAYQMASPRSPALASIKDDQSQTQPAQPPQDADGDVAMNGDNTPVAKVNAEDRMALDSKDAATSPTEPGMSSALTSGRKFDPFIDAVQPIINTLQVMNPAEVWERMNPEFYVMFWSLQLGDLNVPQASYELEHDRLNKEAEDVMRDRSDMTRAGMNKKDEKKRAFLDLAKSIREEMKSHVERYQKTRFRLTKLFKSWFPAGISDASSTSDIVIEQCLLPRLRLSASDTEYCFRMIKFLHENRAPNFKLLVLYERFFSANRLRSMIFSCTVREAEHLGRFIKLILEDLTRWHWDKSLYEKEALGQKGSGGAQTRNYLGFATAFDEDGKPTAFVEHSSFQDSHYEWHKNLNIALKNCLAGMEWMHIRNAITVLKVTSDFFPAINFMGKQLLEQLDTIRVREAASKSKDGGDSEEGHRVDLSVTAQTAYSALKKREPKWVMVQAFRSNMSGRPQEGPKGSESAMGAGASNLRPTAPAFKPNQTANTSAHAAEVEDGEVKDSRDSRFQFLHAFKLTALVKFETMSGETPPQETRENNEIPVIPVMSAIPAKPAIPAENSEIIEKLGNPEMCGNPASLGTIGRQKVDVPRDPVTSQARSAESMRMPQGSPADCLSEIGPQGRNVLRVEATMGRRNARPRRVKIEERQPVDGLSMADLPGILLRRHLLPLGLPSQQRKSLP
ncbi:THO complex subunit 2 [Pleurostoma richardsiae]|uniref:THO complex subunit 2 n=1 Tax=Pleurostoma richardsiae TaxID=41990 RepID=A0AA38VC45_9PEZI|nr:THO complex subunit 2 [Pleurostoma richardsiae]